MSGVEQRIKVTFEHPRSWWRRLLRLPARRSERGPYDVRPWVELMETNQGPVAEVKFTMNTSQSTFTPTREDERRG
jgi:hypothetical protein